LHTSEAEFMIVQFFLFVEVSGHNLESSQTFEVSVYKVYITNQLKTTCSRGRGVKFVGIVQVAVNNKEEDS